MYCRKCGAEIKETSKFCDNCGCEVVKVKQVSYAEKYNENKKKSKNQAQSNKEQERMMKHKDEKNPYIAASLFATVVAIVLAMFPWNLLGSGINKFTYENSSCYICFIGRLSCNKSKTSK